MSFLSTGKAENSAPQHIDVKITPSVDHGGYLIEISPSLFVRAGNIPNWIADALVPEPDAVPTLCVLQKTVLVSEGHWMHSELSSADYALLDEIAEGISRVSGSTTQAEWSLIREAFENAPDKPSWGVLAQFTNPHERARVERSNTRRSHFDRLDAAIQRGRLAAFTAARLPASKLAHDTWLSFSDAQAYLKPLGFHLQAISSTFASKAGEAAPPEQPEAKNTVDSASKVTHKRPVPAVAAWIEAAQVIAQQYIARHKRENLFPSLKDVSEHVESELRKRGTFGPHGRPVSAAYIQRTALGGEWWKANKP